MIFANLVNFIFLPQLTSTLSRSLFNHHQTTTSEKINDDDEEAQKLKIIKAMIFK